MATFVLAEQPEQRAGQALAPVRWLDGTGVAAGARVALAMAARVSVRI